MTPTLYQVLQIAENASDAEVRAAHRRMVKVSHPDNGGNPKAFIAVQTAYEVLGNPLARRLYDLELAQKRRPFRIRVSGVVQYEFCVQKSDIVRTLKEAADAFDGKDCKESLLTLADMFSRLRAT